MRHFRDGTRFYRGYDHDNYQNILGMLRNGTRVGKPFESFHDIILYVVDGEVWIFHGGKHCIDYYGKSAKGEAWRRLAAENSRKRAKPTEPTAFTLRNDPPKAKHRRGDFHGQERTLQKVLIDGLDCLPGQQDLF